MNNIKNAALSIACFLVSVVYGQTYYFTNAGATGSVGPTQLQINTSYTNSNLQNAVISNGGIQNWTVATTGEYNIMAKGAKGGGNGGNGAFMTGDFNLIAGQVLQIIVGQKGELGINSSNTSGGGGGGSFIILGTDSLLMAAGGGGGGGQINYSGGNASTLTLGGSTIWNGGGNNGNGGNNGVTNGDAAGGGGFYTNGQNSYNISQNICEGGKSFFNGATGGAAGNNGPYYGGAGGFGGGGSSWNNGIIRGGGGGGFSGGQGGTLNAFAFGAGGGSYNIGSNQNNQEGIVADEGFVTITYSKRQFPLGTLSSGGTGYSGTNTTPTSSVSTSIDINERSISSTQIYPNPNSGHFVVEVATHEAKMMNYSLFTTEGRLICKKQSLESKILFDISELSSGIYYLKIGNSRAQKIIKK